MHKTMSLESLNEAVRIAREKYSKLSSKKYRSAFLTSFCEQFGYTRKYAQKLLRGARDGSGAGRRARSGRPCIYTEKHIEVLKFIWLQADQPCGRRLAGAMADWVRSYERNVRRLLPKIRDALGRISYAQLDRLIAQLRVKEPRVADWRRWRSNGAVKAQIPERAERWNVGDPGWMEVDCVALCGGNMSDYFTWILTGTDVWSGWTELRPMWNRSASQVIKHYDDMMLCSPFEWKGVDSDNGGEFINWQAIQWKRVRDLMGKRMELTRSRAYHKNDQAYVEQKNNTHVREFFGYERYGYQEIGDAMMEVCRAWSLYNNLYRPTMKQISMERVGSKRRRRHEKIAKSPAMRIIEHEGTPLSIKNALIRARKVNDPMSLRAECERGLKFVWTLIRALEQKPYSSLERDRVVEEFGPLKLDYKPISLA